ncbi:MAG: thymidylate synthase [Oscillospiraceae bacterium]|nr:thymidylate synthase [Oscillospiraceae bacterium]
MNELFVRGASLPEAYHNALESLHKNYDELPCPDYNTFQKEASMTFVVENPLMEPMISKLFIGDPRSLEQYRQEILDGILDFEVDHGKWDYTYHLRMEKQIPWVINELRRSNESRRAVVLVRSEYDMSTDSPACLQHLQFLIRGDALHCKVLFRSNDATKATFMNAFALIMLQKKIADILGVSVGSYTHRANSFHVYKRDYDMFDGYVRRINSGGELTYFFKGDWDELMEEAKPEITRMIDELRAR